MSQSPIADGLRGTVERVHGESGRQWLSLLPALLSESIDPKGIVGDPGYEVGPFMLNQLPCKSSESAMLELLDERLSIFSDELSIKRERLARWAFCHAVLSAVWDFEVGAEWGDTIRLAWMLERLG